VGCLSSMLGMFTIRWGALAALVLLASACSNSQSLSSTETAISEVNSRENRFPSYPQPNTTYLSFSSAHGFQVNYIAPQGKAWLWYPGNQRVVPEEYKQDIVSGQEAICWRHPSNSYNPVTQASGGAFACQSLALTQRTIVAALPGDPFSLETGTVPFPLERCIAPVQFSFDRNKISC